jgi:hypothetical protein
MKDSLFDALTQDKATNAIVDRRSFVKFGAAGLGVLAGASSAMACLPCLSRRTAGPVVVEGPPLMPLPLPPAEIPLARLTFEVSSGVNPQYMLRLLQDYIAQTLSPDWAGQVVQAQAVQQVPRTFHQNYWSDYRFNGQIPPTRTRYGYYTGVNELARADAQASIRAYQDLNYFEMRRVINASEVNTFGLPMVPYNYRRPPVPADMEAFYRVSRNYYGIANPQAYTLVYVRQFSNGRNAYNGYLISRWPDPVRSPFKDLLIDNLAIA